MEFSCKKKKKSFDARVIIIFKHGINTSYQSIRMRVLNKAATSTRSCFNIMFLLISISISIINRQLADDTQIIGHGCLAVPYCYHVGTRFEGHTFAPSSLGYQLQLKPQNAGLHWFSQSGNDPRGIQDCQMNPPTCNNIDLLWSGNRPVESTLVSKWQIRLFKIFRIMNVKYSTLWWTSTSEYTHRANPIQVLSLYKFGSRKIVSGGSSLR